MTAPGGSGTLSKASLPRARRTGFSHRVGASMANRLRTFAWIIGYMGK